MGSFKLGSMTFGSLFKKPETLLYPFEQKTPHPGLKGQVNVDMASCILCGICQKTCPASAIVVDKQKAAWTIDRFSCVQCGSCIRACPKTCLQMQPNYQKPSRKMEAAVFSKPQESEDEKEAKEAAKRAKIEAAMKAKAQREAAAE